MASTADRPQLLGPYRLIESIGTGGMGRVYRAQHVHLEREVALKLIRSKALSLSHIGERFMDEARSLARINSPYVVTCYDVGEFDGMLYLATELMTGGDAGQLQAKRGGQIDEMEALQVIRDVAQGLEALAAAGLIHRDIKPKNIFLAEGGHAKLGDFGLAIATGTSVKLTEGTPSYMPPEQVAADGVLDIRSDIYAVGATLYALLTGRPPFMGSEVAETLQMILAEPVPDPRRIRPDLSDLTWSIVMRCLSKDPELRFPNPIELRLACEQALEATRGPLMALGDKTPKGIERLMDHPPGRMSIEVGDLSMSLSAVPSGTEQRSVNKLSKHVRLSEDKMRAWINLAPDTSFPRSIIEQMLATAGIIYGIQRGAVVAATVPSERPRRLVLAIGQPPTPGMPGCDVLGKQQAQTEAPLTIRVADDGMVAYALVEPGVQLAHSAVQAALVQAGLRFGVDKAAVENLSQEAPSSACVIIANGRQLVDRVQAGFHIGSESLTTGPDNWTPVKAGQALAVWNPGSPGHYGRDVYGHKVRPAAAMSLRPDEQAGAGTSISRTPQGELLLQAEIDGWVQQRTDGVIRVVTMREWGGDLVAASRTLEVEEVLVVRGHVRKGVRIHAASDVIIIGDVEDAEILAGGSLEIVGEVLTGQQSIVVGDTLVVHGDCRRRVVTGSAHVFGTLWHSELIAAEDGDVQRVVGGRVLVGGNLTVGYAGDHFGTTTELFAGRCLGHQEQAELATLRAGHLADERRRVRRESNRLMAIQDGDGSTDQDSGLGSDAIRRQQQRLKRLESAQHAMDEQGERARARYLAEQGTLSSGGQPAVSNTAEVYLRVLAYAGVMVGIGDMNPYVLREDKPGFRFSSNS